jgi:hypothetical protein
MMKCEAPAGRPRRRRRSAHPVAVVLAVLLPAACDIPTQLPRFEPRFVVPVEGTGLGVGDLLPASVTQTGTAFRVNIPGASTQLTLGDMCEPCRGAHLAVVPKPAFTHGFSVTAALPQQVASAVVAAADVQVRVRHSLGFDPLQPTGRTENGTLTLTVTSGGRQLGTAVVTGPLPPGADLLRTISLAPGDIAGPLELLVVLVSPAGGPVLINRDALFRVDVLPTAVTASEARVVVTGRQVSVRPFQVDLTGMDEELRGRVRSGALIMVMDNPFAVGGALQLRLRVQDGADIQRNVNVAAGRTSQRVELSQQEIRSLLGQWVNVSLTGPVSGTAGPVTVRPGTEITLEPRLELVLEIGS